MRPTNRSATLEEVLRSHARSAAPELARHEGEGKVRCLACAHRCLVRPGATGLCKIRFVEDGGLQVPWGYVAGLAVDPIEKKPFYHVLPGREALSFGMLGCNFHCDYCQNWMSSQTLRDPAATASIREIAPEEIVGIALARGVPILTSTYNEPLITSEWGVEIFQLGRAHGLRGSCVSNGHATPEALRYLRPFVSYFKVDLKSFDEAAYRRLGGRLEAVRESIQTLRDLGVWVEAVTLLVPGFNDDDDELRAMTGFLAEVSRDIPWHVTAFHPDYNRPDTPRTSAACLVRAAEIGRKAGLRHVYCGNLPGRVGDWEHTHCPECGGVVVERTGFHVRNNRMGADGLCPDCGCPIAGAWN